VLVFKKFFKNRKIDARCGCGNEGKLKESFLQDATKKTEYDPSM
jgi:hypothetical protein